MNRRSFFGALLKGAAAFTILPSAGRVWKATRAVPNPLYENAEYDVMFAAGKIFRSPQFEHLPSFQDFCEQHENIAAAAWEKFLSEDTHKWPLNMGETKRIIIPEPPIIYRRKDKIIL